jgi:tetratricopeptide (TPR) repeat protein
MCLLVGYGGLASAQTPTPDPFVLPTPRPQATLDDVQAYLARGIAWYNKSQFVYALDDFIKASALDEANAEARFWQARAYVELGATDETIALMDAWLAQDPNAYRAYVMRGYARLLAGQSQEGEADFQRANALEPNNPLHFYYLGLYYTSLGDYEGAVIVLDQAHALAPDDLDIANARGIAYHGAGRNEAALAEFDRAIALDPTSALAYVNKAIVSRKLNRLNDAQGYIAQALEANPDYALAYMLRALIQIQQGNATTNLDAYRVAYESALASVEAYLQAEHPAQVQSSMLSLRAQLLRLLGR